MNLEDCFLCRPTSLDEAGEGDVCFTRSWREMDRTEASVVIGPEPAPPVEGWIGVENPRAAMNEVIRFKMCIAGADLHDSGISHDARINWENVEMGNDVYVEAGCVIGWDGFAYDRIDGELRRFPHLGKVIIGNNVEIEANTHVARGSLKDTVIRAGVKIDSNVHVGHNDYIGEDTLITAGAILGGSVTIGKRCWIGLGAVIRDGVTVGDDACVGMGAIVVKNVPPGVTVIGNPAREMVK